jgi:diaminopimelate decarboxylase
MGNTDTVERSRGRKQKPQAQLLSKATLDDFVFSFLKRREEFLGTQHQHGSPLYILEQSVVRKRVAQFQAAFRGALKDIKAFYAIKSNNYPELCKLMIKSGLGLDASSGVELELAVSSGATEVLFSGPGKTEAELNLAAKHREKVTVLIDSFGELQRLEQVAARSGRVLRAGVRLTTDDNGLWRKFGIPLVRLDEFLSMAENFKHVSLRGLQFHTSWNLSPKAQIDFIEKLGSWLAVADPSVRQKIAFIDLGGGYWPAQGEWVHKADAEAVAAIGAHADAGFDPLRHYLNQSVTIEEYAAQIGQAVGTHILPYVQARFFLEPGRWLCNDAMHILLTVVDKKAEDLVITDAGTNAVGWERFETDYFPVINLSRPEREERPCLILGSLCTPHDVWGYSYYGESIEVGDILLIPTQGAYTYSLRQNFIKPLPKPVSLEGKQKVTDWDLDD